jgi:hypothetical protein
MSDPDTPGAETEPEEEEEERPARREPAAAGRARAAAPEAAPSANDSTSRRSRLRGPTVFEAGAFVTLVGGIVGLVFLFAPGCRPQPPSDVSEATISNVRIIPRVTFERYLQRLQVPIPPEMTEKYLARRGALVEFDWKIVGLRGKHLPFGWELLDHATNERVAAEMTPYELKPSKNEDSGSWAIWMHGQKPGRTYYGTVTIYKPEGPPDELKHFPTDAFRGFAST